MWLFSHFPRLQAGHHLARDFFLHSTIFGDSVYTGFHVVSPLYKTTFKTIKTFKFIGMEMVEWTTGNDGELE